MANGRQIMGVRISRWRGIGLAAFAVATVAFVSPATGLVSPLAYHNSGSSLPQGWYWYSHSNPPARGEVVMLRNVQHFRGGILLKRAVGIPGDSFCWNPKSGTHLLNGKPMAHPLPEATAIGISVWKGCRLIAADEIVGYGDTPESYDSRYLGPVKQDALWGVYRPL